MADIKPWETNIGRTIWKSEAQFRNYIRGGIRQGLWMRNPLKLEFMKRNRIRVPLGRKTEKNPEGLVWGGICDQCNNQFKSADLQVDHIIGNHKFLSMDDLRVFVEAMIFIDPEEDLRFSCKPCHKIKSYSEQHGISFEEAKLEKQVIEIVNGNDKQWLIDNGLEPESNAKKRRQQIKEALKNGIE